MDAHKNFATSLVATAPSPATSGTSLVVTTGEGTRFPATPFNAVVCPANAIPTPANAEIIRVTVTSTDTFSTIVRAQEGTSARTIVAGDRIYAGETAKTLTDIEAMAVASDTQVRYVDATNGNDSNNGFTLATAKQTLQAAYSSLPAGSFGGNTIGGGRIICTPGDYNVYNSGNGFLIDCFKPVILTSLTGTSLWRQPDSTGSEVRLYSSGSLSKDALVTIQAATSGTHNDYGNTFLGILFDLGTAIKYGVHGYNANRVLFRDCVGIGSDSSSVAQYLGRAQQTTFGDDASWWRFITNTTYKMGLHKAGSFASDADTRGAGDSSYGTDDHNYIGNIVGLGAKNNPGINLSECTRCKSYGNNIQGTGTTVIAIQLERVVGSMFIGDAGEGIKTFIRAIGTTSNNSNLFAPAGVPFPISGMTLISDDNAKRNQVLAPARLANYNAANIGTAEAPRVTATQKTANYTVLVTDELVRCSAAGGDFTVSLPTAVNAVFEVHTIRNYGASGTVTVDSPTGGSITGQTLVGAGHFVTYISDGTNWYAMGAFGSHTHPASDIASGTIATARLGSGTADNTKALLGDQTWAQIANAQVSSSAAIAYGKLALTNAIVNGDIASAAAIAYSKLNLATSIVNADIATSAAIAYSKLNLGTSIVNADIASGAAIALSKLATDPLARANHTGTQTRSTISDFAHASTHQIGGADALTLPQYGRDNKQLGQYVPGYPNTSYNMAANVARAGRLVLSRDMTIIAIAFCVQTAASTDDSVDVGIYDASFNRLTRNGGLAGNLNSTGVKVIGVTSVALTANTIYYVAIACGTLGGTAAVIAAVSWQNINTGALFGVDAGEVENLSSNSSYPMPTSLTYSSGISQVPFMAIRETNT